MNKLNLNNGIKFSCQSSGNCCVSRGNHGYVYLSKDDLNKLAIFFNLSDFVPSGSPNENLSPSLCFITPGSVISHAG